MILSDNETRLDILNNRAIAKTVTSIIMNSTESVSIGVHGDWGAGKSSVLAMIEEELSSDLPPTSDWNDDEEKDWDVIDDRSDLFPCVVVRFNSWQYQGFEDAKIALMSVITAKLENASKVYYKHHKIKGGLNKLKEIVTRVWKNIDKLGLIKNTGKLGMSIVTGTTLPALFTITTDHISDVVKDTDKTSKSADRTSVILQNDKGQESGFKEMEEFRKNFSDLFKEAHTEKLVVLIDDLDRCLPKTTIETLEAIRMFLSLDNSAFVIAADDVMIRYAVNEYFPRSPENNNSDTLGEFADKYLEKLIQVPLHIPRIGIREAQIYTMALLIESKTGESTELRKLVEVIIKKLHKPWELEQLSSEEIKNIFGEKYESILNEVMIAKNIDHILAENTNGNPRSIKRFINMLILRTDVAHNRGFTNEELKMSILAKIMLVEQYDNEFYKAIAEDLDQNGIFHAFDHVKGNKEDDKPSVKSEEDSKFLETQLPNKGKTVEKNRKKRKVSTGTEKEIAEKDSKILEYLEKGHVKKWMSIEPSLEGVDLRPYFFACTEREDFFFESTDERIRELLYAVNAGKFAVAQKKKTVERLSNDDAKTLFKKASQSVFKSNLSGNEPPMQLEGLRTLVEYRPELQDSMGEFLLTLPLEDIGIWAIGNWDSSIPQTSPAREKLNIFYQEIVTKNKDSIVVKAAKKAME